MDGDDDIPLLTDVIRRDRRSPERLTDAQIRKISAASAGLIVRVVKDALADVERQLVLRISRELNEQLPSIVIEAMRADSDKPDPENR